MSGDRAAADGCGGGPGTWITTFSDGTIRPGRCRGAMGAVRGALFREGARNTTGDLPHGRPFTCLRARRA